MRITLVGFIEFLVQYMFFVLSASVHESAHAWSAFKLGDPTAKMQNRISLNPANHIDIVGTVIIPFLVFFQAFRSSDGRVPRPSIQEIFRIRAAIACSLLAQVPSVIF